jgi:lipoyl(octanoyl) transferase
MSEDMQVNSEAAEQTLVVRMIDGLLEYEPVWKAMQGFTDTRGVDSEDQVWLLQHRPVFTQGQAGKEEHILRPGDIPVVQVDRGGQVTYHGPGQLVVYTMFDIDRMGIGARQLVSGIEDSILGLLKLYGVDAVAKQDAPGVYVDDEKNCINWTTHSKRKILSWLKSKCRYGSGALYAHQSVWFSRS